MKKILILVSLLAVAARGNAQTSFGKNTGEYGEFFLSLKEMLTNKNPEGRTIQVGNKNYTLLVPWIRDHVHVMKAMKYFMQDATTGTQLFLEQQTPEGFFYDYIYPIESDVINRLNFFHPRFTKLLVRDKWQMHRVPVEADVEYLVVEGVYAIWQSTGDTAFLHRWLPALEKAMNYVKTDPMRWSNEYQLVKRGYTIDTWDFQYLPFTRKEYSARYGDPSQAIMDVKDTTFMGIMHGDNSGMFAACRQLAAMYAALGKSTISDIWNKEAELYQARANAYLWNGKYYKHFLPIGQLPPYIKFDIEDQLSLSNPYDINRGLPEEPMAQSIIQSYIDLKEKTKDESIAEWFSLYPAVKPGWADVEAGTYVNGGVLIVTAGELAKAAFQHGYEEYGADILRRLYALSKKSNNFLYACYRPDGQVDGGLPDNWAQAAVLSAMVEGLAGVVDKSSLFSHVELTPRWLAAGRNEASVTIEYGPSGKRLAYDYRHDAKSKTISLKARGGQRTYHFRILLPPGVNKATATLDGKKLPLRFEKVRNSVYAVAGAEAAEANLLVKY